MKYSYSVKTILRKDKSKKDGTCPMYYQIILNSSTLRLPVGKSLKPTDWDFKKCYPKGMKFNKLKRNLEKREQSFKDFITDCELQDRNVSLEMIKSFYNGNGTKDFYSHFEKFCKKKFRTIKPGTQYHYELLGKQLKKYRPKLSISDLDYSFFSDFFEYLRDEGVGPSGIATRRKTLICTLEEFIRLDLLNRNYCKLIPKPKEKVREEYLDVKEITRLKKLNLNIGSMEPGLNLTRDLFLFSCYTGLRYSDVISITKDHFKNNSIELRMKKTNKKVKVFLKSEAIALIMKYKSPYRKTLFPYRSNVAVNRDLKLLARWSKINKRVSFHTGRHTFGSLLANNNVPASHIMKLMGHGDLSMTGRYMNSDEDTLEKSMLAVNFN